MSEDMIVEENSEEESSEKKNPKFKKLSEVLESVAEFGGIEMGNDEEVVDFDEENETEDIPGHLIRVSNQSKPEKLAYHIIRCIQMYGIAETQSIGAPALSKALFAIVRAEGLAAQYTTNERLCVIPCIRKPTMRNGEERTAIRLRILPVLLQHLR